VIVGVKVGVAVFVTVNVSVEVQGVPLPLVHWVAVGVLVDTAGTGVGVLPGELGALLPHPSVIPNPATKSIKTKRFIESSVD
jgi:hypothetical protein